MARILVLDDDKLFGALMRRALGQRAHEVTLAETAGDARATLAAGTFDAMVCDIILPDENGLHLLRDVCANYPAMATIAISGGKAGGKSLPVDVLHLAQTVGVDAVVKKPLELTSFVATVESALTEKQAAPSIRKQVS
ncbi:MAG: response regulator [Alphaproteobacteria bacterium]|nr:response regulator [Alphaproteobacteria bacterium]